MRWIKTLMLKYQGKLTNPNGETRQIRVWAGEWSVIFREW